jgi:hypothetical protein
MDFAYSSVHTNTHKKYLYFPIRTLRSVNNLYIIFAVILTATKREYTTRLRISKKCKTGKHDKTKPSLVPNLQLHPVVPRPTVTAGVLAQRSPSSPSHVAQLESRQVQPMIWVLRKIQVCSI